MKLRPHQRAVLSLLAARHLDADGLEVALRRQGHDCRAKQVAGWLRTEIAAKKRAYYEQNKDEIAAKKRASRTCCVCGDRMRHPSETGMCGFCEDELAGSRREIEAA